MLVLMSKIQNIIDQLVADGLILQSDAVFPSVTNLVTGESIKGSWWGHARGTDIFNACTELADHKDVMVTKLVGSKVTFVHRALWAAVLGVGQAKAPWQFKGLSPVAKALFERVQKEGEVKPEALVAGRQARASSFSPYITELEKRMLVIAEEVHTEAGSHARIIYSWDKWAKAHHFKGRPLGLSGAQEILEGVVERLNQKSKAKAKLPWQ